jgi:hypothetical protein
MVTNFGFPDGASARAWTPKTVDANLVWRNRAMSSSELRESWPPRSSYDAIANPGFRPSLQTCSWPRFVGRPTKALRELADRLRHKQLRKGVRMAAIVAHQNAHR